jgi:hypothetical protein
MAVALIICRDYKRFFLFADPSDYVTIYNAILTINMLTCIKFVPWDGKAKDFLLIWPVKYPKG